MIASCTPGALQVNVLVRSESAAGVSGSHGLLSPNDSICQHSGYLAETTSISG